MSCLEYSGPPPPWLSIPSTEYIPPGKTCPTHATLNLHRVPHMALHAASSRSRESFVLGTSTWINTMYLPKNYDTLWSQIHLESIVFQLIQKIPKRFSRVCLFWFLSGFSIPASAQVSTALSHPATGSSRRTKSPGNQLQVTPSSRVRGMVKKLDAKCSIGTATGLLLQPPAAAQMSLCYRGSNVESGAGALGLQCWRARMVINGDGWMGG